MQEYRNIYQIARESTGLTQEKASELLDISVDSLRAYEGGKRVPPGKIVVKMVEIYNTQFLAIQHLKAEEVGKRYLPNIKIRTLSEAVLSLLYECEDLEEIKKPLIRISKDNKIDETEKVEWDFIMKELDDVMEAFMSLKFTK